VCKHLLAFLRYIQLNFQIGISKYLINTFLFRQSYILKDKQDILCINIFCQAHNKLLLYITIYIAMEGHQMKRTLDYSIPSLKSPISTSSTLKKYTHRGSKVQCDYYIMIVYPKA